MAILSTISAHIIVDNHALHEYPDPQTTSSPEPGTTSQYIEVISNMAYSIYIKIPADYNLLSDVLVLKVFPDGKFSFKAVHRNVPFAGRIEHESLRFPLELAAANRNEPGDAHMWEDKEIMLQVSHGKIVETLSDFDLLFGQPRRKAVPISDAESVLAFTWKYRPLRILKSTLALPRIPFSSLPLLDPTTVQAPTFRPEHPQDVAWKERLLQTAEPELYCYCKRITGGPVVACDNDECPIKHFHMFCVGLREQPKRLWLCEECRRLPEESLRVKALR